jgi:hypothetical protein
LGRKLFEGGDQIFIFVLRGNFLEWPLNPEGRQRIGGEGETTFGTIPMSQLCDMIFQKKPFPRVLMINLTHLKRELGKALNCRLAIIHVARHVAWSCRDFLKTV